MNELNRLAADRQLRRQQMTENFIFVGVPMIVSYYLIFWFVWS